MTRCRSCGAEVLWAITENGRPMMIDAEPAEDGNIVLRDDGLRTALATVLSKDLAARMAQTEPAPRLYRAHFATCPQADDWRTR